MTKAATVSEEELKLRFVEYNKPFNIEASQVGALLVLALMPVGAVLDIVVYPDFFALFLLLRVVCSVIAGVGWRLLKTSFGERFYRPFGLFLFLLPSAFISLMIYYTEGVDSPYYAGLNLVLVGMSWVVQMRTVDSIVAVLLTLVMYGTACLMHGADWADILLDNVSIIFIVLTGVIAVTGTYLMNRSRFREYVLRYELDSNRKQLEVSNAKLLEMDKAKTNFFANISHELRTPLTLLIGPLDRLRSRREQPTESEKDELLDIMQQNAMRLMRLINDLLNLVRLDSGSLKLRPERMDLRSYIDGICRSFSPMAKERKLTFTWEIETENEDAANLDRDKVEKILLNVLFNAIKFTPSGGQIELRAWREGELLCIEVEDTGHGIDPEALESIFDRFWQADSSSNRRYQGVGIGLALVRDLARLHGGDVKASSVVGEGTVMRISLNVEIEIPSVPIEKEGSNGQVDTKWLEQLYRRAEFFPARASAKAEVAEIPKMKEDLNKTMEESGERPAVLVADDEPEMMRFLCSQLQHRYDIYRARDGAEALEKAKERRYHLILLDYMMPHLDGIEVTRLLREMPSHRAVPVVILTARADEESKFEALDAGATDFLTKPFSSTELVARCRNLASVYDMQQQIEERTTELEEALVLIKQTETQMVQQAKMASLGQLSAGLLHEVNNPLNFATTSIHLIKKRLSKEPHPKPELLEKPLTDLHDGIRRVSSIVSSLREFTHPDTARFERVELSDAVNTAIRFVQIPGSEVNLTKSLDGCEPIRGNQNQLVHLFINFLQNAVDSLREKGADAREIAISGRTVGDQVEITFQDNGMGIAPEEINRIFDAFFTTKKVGQGVGLGLSICHRIIQQHKGTISVESDVGEWCRFTVSFPVYQRLSTGRIQ